MSRKDAVTLASRTLALLMTVWALADMSYLPGRLNSFLHYANSASKSSNGIDYGRHYYVIELGFLITRIVGFSLLARWLYKGGEEVEQLLLPEPSEREVPQN